MADLDHPFFAQTKKGTRDPKKIGAWKVGRTIGSGAAGRVRIARHSVTGQLAAIKIVPRATLDSQMSIAGSAERDALILNREISIMKCVNHPNILSLYDVWETSSSIYLILEYVQGGELFDYICSKGRLDTAEALDYFQQIIQAMDYCHRFNIAHRDLKPENILLDQDMNIKIADFGMAAYQQPNSQLVTACGSPHYAAPEVVNNEIYDGGPADVWSCGVTLFALLAGRLPFDDDDLETLLDKVRVGDFEMPSDIDPLAQDLLSKMLTKDTVERITMRQIQEHPFFVSRPPKHQDIVLPDLESISQPVDNIDPLIWPNLQTLFDGTHPEDLEAALRSPEKNWEKGLYHMLLDYRQRVLKKQGETEYAKRARSARPPRRRAITTEFALHQASSTLPPRAAPPTPSRATNHNIRLASRSSGSLTTTKISSPQLFISPAQNTNISSSPFSSNSPRLWDPLRLPPIEVPPLQDEKMTEFLSQIVYHLNTLQARVASPSPVLDSPIPSIIQITRPLSINRKPQRPTIDTSLVSGIGDKENDGFLMVDPTDIPSNCKVPVTPTRSHRGRKISISIKEPARTRSKLKKRYSNGTVSPGYSVDPPSPTSPWSTTSSKRSWISSVFKLRSTPYTLLSTHNAQTTRSECRRLLMELDVRVVLEDAESLGVLKCRLDETVTGDGSVKLKSVKFRVVVRPYDGPSDYEVYLQFVQEKGSAESLKETFRAVKNRWVLDGFGSLTPQAVMAEPPRLHLRSLTS